MSSSWSAASISTSALCPSSVSSPSMMSAPLLDAVSLGRGLWSSVVLGLLSSSPPVTCGTDTQRLLGPLDDVSLGWGGAYGPPWRCRRRRQPLAQITLLQTALTPTLIMHHSTTDTHPDHPPIHDCYPDHPSTHHWHLVHPRLTLCLTIHD